MHIIIQSCVLFLWLHNLNFVKSEGCTLALFIDGNLYDRNFDTTDLQRSYPDGKSIRVPCRLGYTGFFRLVCTENGWMGIGDKCQPKSCGHPGDAQFADFTLEGEDFVFGSQVVYTCQKGYQMFSHKSVRHCMDKGWDGVVPVCQAVKCPVIEVDDNVQMIGDPEEATFGNVIRFSCKSRGDVLSSSQEIYCNEHGAWSAEIPKCKAISCPVPVITNGRELGNIQEYQEYDILNFRCNDRYKAADERPSTCTKIGQRAVWSPTPACEPITCRLSVEIEGTKYDPPFKNVFTPGESVRVTCGNEYYIIRHQDTSAVATCKNNGQWDIRPQCKVGICQNPNVRYLKHQTTFLRQQGRFGSIVDYECKEGYKSTNGMNQAKCSREGWIPTPLCQAITCQPRTDIVNAAPYRPKRVYYDQERINYYCKKGYEGQYTLTCTGNGWKGNPYCTPLLCNRIDIENAIIVNPKQVYNHEETAEYICADGFMGRFSLICDERNWRGESWCEPKTCSRKDFPNAHIVGYKRQVYNYKEVVQYVCKVDQRVRFSLTCEQEGWVGSSQCPGSTCPVPVITNGRVLGNIHEYREYDILNFQCNDRYKAADERPSTCTKRGQRAEWSPTPACEPITCSRKDFPNANIVGYKRQVYDYKEVVQYVCKVDQDVSFSLTCEQEGWVGSSQCPRSTCPVPVITNGRVLGNIQEYQEHDILNFQCNDRYKAADERPSTCTKRGQRAEWSHIPACEPITCSRKDVPNANIVGYKRQVYDYKEVVQYVCKVDQDVRFSLTCEQEGWVGSSQCPADCIKPDLEHGFVVGPTKNTLYYACDEFYKPLTGSWWGRSKCGDLEIANKCIDQNICGEPPMIPNMVTTSRKDYKHTESVSVICDEGFSAKIEKFTCVMGNWDFNGTSLERICVYNGRTCSAPPPAWNAVIESSPQKEYLSGTVLKYRCRDHYTMAGDDTITCNNGTWEEKNITCASHNLKV